MRADKIFLFICFSLIYTCATAQRIVYSDHDKEDTRRLNFDIVGKVNGNFLIYKNIRNNNWITVLDNDMVQVSKEPLDFVPDNDRMINTDFFPYSNHAFMVYQYQKKNIIYCMAARIGGDGKKIGDVMELDTTHIGFSADNKIYTVLSSEDKSKIGLLKINSRNKKAYLMTSLLFDDNLQLLKKSQIEIPMEERNDYLSDFNLDNEGNIVFSRFVRTNNDNINSASLIIKYAQADTLVYNVLNLDKKYLDEVHIKIDNYNNRYFLSSLYFNERRGNIDGIYFYIWDKATAKPEAETVTIFSDELRREAKGDAGIKMAFNNYFLRDIITRRDGGFIVGSESYYTTSRFNNWNRWNYLYGSPYSSGFYNNYYYSPFYDSYYGWRSRSNYNQGVRYHADNIMILSFDAKGQLEWNNVISKSQYDDETDDMISYQLMNEGSEIHFLFNQQERRTTLLNDFSLSPGGEIGRSPTLKNLDKGYEFMPKYGKQVSARQMIIPCLNRNYICFAKIEYN